MTKMCDPWQQFGVVKWQLGWLSSSSLWAIQIVWWRSVFRYCNILRNGSFSMHTWLKKDIVLHDVVLRKCCYCCCCWKTDQLSWEWQIVADWSLWMTWIMITVAEPLQSTMFIIYKRSFHSFCDAWIVELTSICPWNTYSYIYTFNTNCPNQEMYKTTCDD